MTQPEGLAPDELSVQPRHKGTCTVGHPPLWFWPFPLPLPKAVAQLAASLPNNPGALVCPALGWWIHLPRCSQHVQETFRHRHNPTLQLCGATGCHLPSHEASALVCKSGTGEQGPLTELSE